MGKRVPREADAGLDAERALLGAILASPGALATAPGLRAEDFADGRHATIFRGIARLTARNAGVDLVTLKHELGAHLAAAGGAVYMAGLVDGVPRHTSLNAWADLVRDGARRRRIRTAGGQLLELADNGADPTKVAQIVELLHQPLTESSSFVPALEAIKAAGPEQVVEGIAFRNSITVFAGESGAGKTFEAYTMAADIGDGVDHHGRRTIRGSVAYSSYEGDAQNLRLEAQRRRGAKLENLYFLRASDPISPRIERDGTEVSSPGETFLTDRLRHLAAGLAAAGLPPIVAVIVDTVRASLSGSEDSSEAVSAYLRAVRRILAAVPGAAMILVHHAGWQDGDQKRKRERGSSAFRGNVDVTLYLEAPGEPEADGSVRLVLRTLKTRDAEKPAPLFLVRRKVDVLGLDRWGDPLSSCIVERDTTTREDREKAAAAQLEASDLEEERELLAVIAAHPEATSVDRIRVRACWGKPRTAEVIARLLRKNWLVEGRRGSPYVLTPAGQQVLGAPTAKGTEEDRRGPGTPSVPEDPRRGPGTPPKGSPSRSSSSSSKTRKGAKR
jgi:AAA domain/DnaB-like helicase N terminal domain